MPGAKLPLVEIPGHHLPHTPLVLAPSVTLRLPWPPLIPRHLPPSQMVQARRVGRSLGCSVCGSKVLPRLPAQPAWESPRDSGLLCANRKPVGEGGGVCWLGLQETASVTSLDTAGRGLGSPTLSSWGIC